MVTCLIDVVVVFATGVGRFRHSQPLEMALLAIPLKYAGLLRFSTEASRMASSASRRSFGAGGLPGKKTTVVLGVPVNEVTVDVWTLPGSQSSIARSQVCRETHSLSDGRGCSLDTEEGRAERRRRMDL